MPEPGAIPDSGLGRLIAKNGGEAESEGARDIPAGMLT